MDSGRHEEACGVSPISQPNTREGRAYEEAERNYLDLASDTERMNDSIQGFRESI